MLKHFGGSCPNYYKLSACFPVPSDYNTPLCAALNSASAINEAPKLNDRRRPVPTIQCRARRRVRYDDEEEEEYGHNAEIAMLELYTQSARGEALLVHATVDRQAVQVLIFKGFSSSLSYGTCPDPSKSILPAKAVIKSIDRIKGPFDPSNVEYIERDLPWDAFRSRLPPNDQT